MAILILVAQGSGCVPSAIYSSMVHEMFEVFFYFLKLKVTKGINILQNI